MGFRFGRRIKILPGLSLNLSGSGISLSAGVRGAHLNFSSKGTYATVGIPGTGLSYRQRVGGPARPEPPQRWDHLQQLGNRQNDALAQKLLAEGEQTLSLSPEELQRYREDPRFSLRDPLTGRHWSPGEIDCKIQELQRQEKLEKAQALVESTAADYRHLLDFWKPLPELPSLEDYLAAQAPRPFVCDLAAPVQPDWDGAKAQLLEELTAELRQHLSYKLLPEVVARKDAERSLAERWPQRLLEIQNAYSAQVSAYEQRRAELQKAWEEQERQRLSWLQRLTAGDLEEIDHTVHEVIAGLRFPFETRCDVFLESPQKLYVHLDLPEIEDVIPLAEKTVLPDGEIQELKRSREDRNQDYAHLVLGQCLFLTAELFSYLPLLQLVQVAAYTQRPRIREADPIDTYVLDIPFEREAVRRLGPNPENLLPFITRQGGRIWVQEDNSLGKIEPPSWLTREDLVRIEQQPGPGE